ncbi:MAG: hypothetical protein SNG38_09015 [Rikenellaceae bacterium]
MRARIDSLIGDNYAQWVNYSKALVYHRGVEIDPFEVVHSVLYYLLNKCPLERIEKILAQGDDSFCRYIQGAIYMEIISPKSRSRYKKGGSVTHSLEVERTQVRDSSDDGFNYNEAYTKCLDVLDRVKISPFARKVLRWRLESGKSFRYWEGKESSKTLYVAYNKAIKAVSDYIARHKDD